MKMLRDLADRLSRSEKRPQTGTAHSGGTSEAPPPYTRTALPPLYPSCSSYAIAEDPEAAAKAAAAGAKAPQPPPTPACEYSMENMRRDDDPHYFLYLFDTVFLVDDSTSMLGSRWREVSSALRQITPVCTSHDDDGIDIHFINRRSSENTTTSNHSGNDGISSLSGGSGKACGGYYNIKDPLAVDALFQRLRPCGPTHTRGRIEDILDPYFAQLESAKDVQNVRPLNLIVITDGMPGPCPQPQPVSYSCGGFGSSSEVTHNPHLPDPAIVRYAKRLDQLRAPAWQVGVQFLQVGNDLAATASLRGLDDGLARRYGVRDIVDTLKFGDGDYKTLTAEEILKAVLGAHAVPHQVRRRRTRPASSSVPPPWGYAANCFESVPSRRQWPVWRNAHAGGVVGIFAPPMQMQTPAWQARLQLAGCRANNGQSSVREGPVRLDKQRPSHNPQGPSRCLPDLRLEAENPDTAMERDGQSMVGGGAAWLDTPT
ncbi:hypothetical protein PCL_07409 [Purpureocillium lilacinum]|uniref:VWFA domain-containing protein n=1 Tax=Purpureocillium lilacinum TaxID=33203 RepID=A0A2U3DS71_PURLI|nr:hypothetical protein PCL_07409 [Purpureocillium lilacinum]